VFVAAPVFPAALPCSKQPWGVAAGFDTVGWGPEGEVYFQYGAAVSGTAYSLMATGDLDCGAPTSDFGYIHPDPTAATIAPPGPSTCAASGVWNAASAPPGANLLDTVGQCEALDGQDEF
jgi:hypothetical protein